MQPVWVNTICLDDIYDQLVTLQLVLFLEFQDYRLVLFLHFQGYRLVLLQSENKVSKSQQLSKSSI